jgi:hypothetical protein
MYLLFLDESGKIDQGGLFALGGIANPGHRLA